MFADLRFAFRQLIKAPAFTATVIVTLALGIGACTVVFSVVNTVLLHPLAAPNPDQLVTLRETRLPDIPDGRVSMADFNDWKNQARTFSSMAAFAYTSFNFMGDGEPLRLSAQRITANYYDVLGVKPALGRSFLPEEETPGKNRVVMLSPTFWRITFGGSPDVIGRTILLNGEPYTIVGVGPENFDRTGDRPLRGQYVSVPLVPTDDERTHRDRYFLNVLARLNAGVKVDQAQVEMKVLTADLATRYPDTNKGGGALVQTTGDYQTRAMRPVLWSLVGAVCCVLLISCANVANVLLARATVRQHEISLRAALGAGRARLIRQLLTESLLLALLGGGLGVLLATWALSFLQTYPATADLERLSSVKLDLGMLAFSVGLSVLTGIVFGLAPAWLSARANLNESLKQNARGSSESGSRGRLRNTFVVMEVACALVLLSSAGLLMKSFIKLAHVDPGFEPERVALVQLFLRGQKYATGIFPKPEPVLAFTDSLLERLRTMPGVETAGVTYVMPMVDAPMDRPFVIEGRAPVAPADRPNIQWSSASADFFKAMGIRLLRGRHFTDQDTAQKPHVALINATLARQYFADKNPVGQRINIGPDLHPDGWREIVGVVDDVSSALDRIVPPQVYEPFYQAPSTQLNFVVRTTAEPASILSSLKAQVYAVDPNQPVGFSLSLPSVMERSLTRQRFAIQLLASFSVIALIITAVGIYGVIAYTVGQRTTEIGIRMALGAQRSDVLRLVLGGGARLIGAGLALGLVGTLAAGRWLQSQLFQTSPHDPLTLTAITLFFAGITAFACWLPALRATKVDPIIALRAE